MMWISVQNKKAELYNFGGVNYVPRISSAITQLWWFGWLRQL